MWHVIRTLAPILFDLFTTSKRFSFVFFFLLFFLVLHLQLETRSSASSTSSTWSLNETVHLCDVNWRMEKRGHVQKLPVISYSKDFCLAFWAHRLCTDTSAQGSLQGSFSYWDQLKTYSEKKKHKYVIVGLGEMYYAWESGSLRCRCRRWQGMWETQVVRNRTNWAKMTQWLPCFQGERESTKKLKLKVWQKPLVFPMIYWICHGLFHVWSCFSMTPQTTQTQ